MRSHDTPPFSTLACLRGSSNVLGVCASTWRPEPRERLATLGLASLSLCEGSASQQHWVPVAIAIIERRRLYACEARNHVLQSDTRRVRKGDAGCSVTE